MSTKRWLVRLSGSPGDLEDLATSFTSDDRRVFKESDLFYLTSSDYLPEMDANEVRQRALEHIQMMNGSAILQFLNNRQVKIDDVISQNQDGTRIHYMTIVAETVSARARGTLSAVSNGSERIVPSTPTMAAWVSLAAQDGAIQKALRILGESVHDWVDLYKLYEVVEEDVGGSEKDGQKKIIRNGWANKEKIELFKHTANCTKAIGDASRHGHSRWEQPDKPMTIAEAKSLIFPLLVQWMDSKIPRTP